MNNLIPLILGMAAVTYLPRLLPFLILSNRTIHKRLDAFLKCIPAAAIGALIIPGVLSATPDMPMAAIGGMVFTLFLEHPFGVFFHEHNFCFSVYIPSICLDYMQCEGTHLSMETNPFVMIK